MKHEGLYHLYACWPTPDFKEKNLGDSLGPLPQAVMLVSVGVKVTTNLDWMSDNLLKGCPACSCRTSTSILQRNSKGPLCLSQLVQS